MSLWTKSSKKRSKPKATAKRFKRVSPISKSRALKLAEYAKLKRQFFKAHPMCQRCLIRPSVDIHHSRGRAGSLLCDTEFWFALCRPCHDDIQVRPHVARVEGYLCAPGLWNVPAKR